MKRFVRALVVVVSLLTMVWVPGAQSPAMFEPPDGQVYHGAFPVSQNSTTPGDYWLDPVTFENLAGKHLAVVLWYGDWSSSFQNSIGSIIDQHLKPAGRVLEVGWMPSQATLDDISNGAWDNYLNQWFTAAREQGQPIFLRFASEMNGNWLNYDGWHNGGSVSTELGWQATEKYKAAWRHVHDLARQMRACNVAFVWSPNYASAPNPNANWPQYAWNDWRNYYPGDNYVDWVGIDLYDFWGENPRDMIRPFYEEYAARKPIMLAETAGHNDPIVDADKQRYIGQLFDAMESEFPRIKAFVWFNYSQSGYNWRIEETPASLTNYQNRVANSRYVGRVTTNTPNASLRLVMQQSGNDLTVSWPECPCTRLERAASLTPPLNWTTVTNGISAAGGRRSLTLTPSENVGFFRLVME
jgi:beta-mannanase